MLKYHYSKSRWLDSVDHKIFFIAVDCTWGEWSDWSECPHQCGIQNKTRTREKFEHECGGTPCEGEAVDYKECDAFADESLALEKCNEEVQRLKDKLCQVVHCQNGGLCLEGDCQCLDGFSGEYCEVTDDPCQFVQCENGGICDAKFGDAECHCPNGFTGVFCEATTPVTVPDTTTPVADTTQPDLCQDVECQNGGFCLQGHCQCLHGFSGENCEETDDPCKDVNCLNGGICDSKFGDADCHCPEGFSGESCEIQIATTPVPATEPPVPTATEPAPASSEPVPTTTEPLPEPTEPLPTTTEPAEPVPTTTEPVPTSTVSDEGTVCPCDMVFAL